MIRKYLSNLKRLLIKKIFGVDFVKINSLIETNDNSRKILQIKLNEISDDIAAVNKKLINNIKYLELNHELLKSQRENTPYFRNKLEEIRRSAEYKATFKNKNPLITVRIASYNKTKELVNRAIASVQDQTYQNFEIVIINDGPNNKTREAVKALKDKRIRYYELPQRSTYPEDNNRRWMVAGSPGMNKGASLAKGEWIAPLDDDDEFANNHLQTLLTLALENKAELSYGALNKVNTVTNKIETIYSNPVRRGGFSFQGALYISKLNIFTYDLESWMSDEPGDWNLCRRMIEAGVIIQSTPQLVGTIYHTPLEARKD